MDKANKEKEADIVTLLFKIFVLLKGQIGSFVGKEGIGSSHGIVIKTISEHQQIQVTRLSKILGLSNSTLSGILEKLKKMNIIERKRSDKDRRVVYVSISREFKKRHGVFHHKINNYIEETIKKAGLEKRNRIIEGLTLLKNLLEEPEKSRHS